MQVKRCSNQGSVHAALALLVASSPRGEPTLLFAVARWVAKLKFLVGNTESIFLSLSLGCIHTASVCCRRVLALSLPLSTQHHSHSCRFAGTKRSSRLPLGCSRYRGPAVVLRVLLWLHIVHLLASHFAPLSFPARENARMHATSTLAFTSAPLSALPCCIVCSSAHGFSVCDRAIAVAGHVPGKC